jgi:hypothetical protein
MSLYLLSRGQKIPTKAYLIQKCLPVFNFRYTYIYMNTLISTLNKIIIITCYWITKFFYKNQWTLFFFINIKLMIILQSTTYVTRICKLYKYVMHSIQKITRKFYYLKSQKELNE